MNVFITVFVLATISAALAGKLLHPLSDEFIAQINAKQSTWKAGRNFEIDEYDLFKTLASGSKGIKHPELLKTRLHDEDQDVPESFDSREAWPECADIIGLIRDQSKCGACWAFAAAEAMSDRICIHSSGERKQLVSSQNILTCTFLSGCNGGYNDLAWAQWVGGWVTGGLYNVSSQGCQSYFLPNCEDHLNNCTPYVETPSCSGVCDDESLDYYEQMTYGYSPGHHPGEKQIQLEVFKNGPVEVAFIIYEDFASYKSGIYQHVAGDRTGSHAVKIVGWGVENDVKYWLIANSWNERWGEDGYFKILRGVNECGIENEAIAALPDFSKF